jgi:hypothetical protein
MQWDGIITAIATSLTAGVAIMLYLLNKPKVELLEVSPIQWWYLYDNQLPRDSKKSGATMTIRIKLKNNGGTNSAINVIFKNSDSKLFTMDGDLELAGKGHSFSNIIQLYLTEDNVDLGKMPLNGTLIIQPWGNRTFFIGRKTINKKVTIPYDIGYLNESV